MENDAVALRHERRPARCVLAHRPRPVHAGGRARASRNAQARLVRVETNPRLSIEPAIEAAPRESRPVITKARQGVSLSPFAPRARARSINALNWPASISPKAAAAPTTIAAPKRGPRARRATTRGAWNARAASSRNPPAQTRARPRRARRERSSSVPRASPAPARLRNALTSLAASVACVGGLALRGQRVFACEKDRKPLVPRRLEANIRVDVAEGQAPQRVEDEAELRRRPAQPLSSSSRAFSARDARSEIERSFGIEVVERTGDDVAHALDLGVGVDEPGFAETRVQIGQRALGQAPQVKIAAPREVDEPSPQRSRASPPRRRPDRATIALSAPARERAARRRSPSAAEPRAPTLAARTSGLTPAARRNRAHAASFRRARVRALELRRDIQKPRFAASSKHRSPYAAA